MGVLHAPNFEVPMVELVYGANIRTQENQGSIYGVEDPRRASSAEGFVHRAWTECVDEQEQQRYPKNRARVLSGSRRGWSLVGHAYRICSLTSAVKCSMADPRQIAMSILGVAAVAADVPPAVEPAHPARRNPATLATAIWTFKRHPHSMEPSRRFCGVCAASRSKASKRDWAQRQRRLVSKVNGFSAANNQGLARAD